MSNTKDSREEDDALWERIQQANTPTRAEMARAELELQAVEPDPSFSVDSARLSTAAAPARRRGGRTKFVATAAALLLMSVLAIAFGNQRDGEFSSRHTFDECLVLIQMPHQYSRAGLAIGPVGLAGLNSAKILRDLATHPSEEVAGAAQAALARIRDDQGELTQAKHADYMAARFLHAKDDAKPEALIRAISDLESVCSKAILALRAFDAPKESQDAITAASMLSKILAVPEGLTR